jgi:hypothetical protein
LPAADPAIEGCCSGSVVDLKDMEIDQVTKRIISYD